MGAEVGNENFEEKEEQGRERKEVKSDVRKVCSVKDPEIVRRYMDKVIIMTRCPR